MADEQRKGLIIVHTGNGKGKTTAAMGMALRAIGYGFSVLMIQFIKGSWHYGELDAAKRLDPYFQIIPTGTGFTKLGHESQGRKTFPRPRRHGSFPGKRLLLIGSI